jgi:hypothetical protein
MMTRHRLELSAEEDTARPGLMNRYEPGKFRFGRRFGGGEAFRFRGRGSVRQRLFLFA